jgi:hypothetical protein
VDFLFFADAEVNQWSRDHPHNGINDFIKVSPAEWKQMKQICNVLIEQKKIFMITQRKQGLSVI